MEVADRIRTLKLGTSTVIDGISPDDYLSHGPIDKFLKHKIVPIGFILHILMALLTGTQVILTNERESPYSTSADYTIAAAFAPDSDFVRGSYPSIRIFNVLDFREDLNKTVLTYFGFPIGSVDYFIYDIKDGKPTPLQMEVYSFQQPFDVLYNLSTSDDQITTKTDYYQLTLLNPLGPFNITLGLLQEYLASVISIEVSFYLLNYEFLPNNDRYLNRWNVSINYDFLNRGGSIVRTLYYSHSRIDSSVQSAAHVTSYVWLPIAISVLAILIVFANNYNVYKTVRLFRRVVAKASGTSEKEITWRSLSRKTRLRLLFSRWNIIAQISNIMNFISCLLIALEVESVIEPVAATNYLLGIGTSMAWLNLMQYFEYDKTTCVMMIALRIGLTSMIYLIFSSFPLIIGFTLYGLSVYGSTTDAFATFGDSFLTIFNGMMGDTTIVTVINSDTWWSTIISRVFAYGFILSMSFVVFNFYMALVWSAWDDAKSQYEESQKNTFQIFWEKILQKELIENDNDDDDDDDDDKDDKKSDKEPLLVNQI
eukprot:TRINITY_DN147_c1_g1_i1.p1 TRINITY_DN147_c1_g1~~TRINITY_DN147_c1_g1_i1.p1  ORF type:complete len:539 (-),score=178.10 TRINITY_DN147_c1_g1_i1:74-1690(-)